MSEPESEDEILDRIEDALRRIAEASARPRPQSVQMLPPQEPPLDREALATTLDSVIDLLRKALTPQPPSETE